MRRLFKNKVIVLALLSLISTVLFSSIRTYADESVLVGHEQEKVILLAQDVSDAPEWCGENTFVIGGSRIGMQWIDILRKKKLKLHSSGYVGATDCTRDGEWLIYVDTRTHRYDKGTYKITVKDFWRYNFKTGKRQKFAISSGGARFSPDERKILFYGPKPRSYIEQPQPKWRLVWVQKKDWPSGHGMEAKWLADSSGIIIIDDGKFYIESLKADEPVRQFDANMGYIHLSSLKVDTQNRIYVLAQEMQKKNGKKLYGKKFVLRCQITDDNLRCEDILKRSKSVARYGVTRDGKDIVFIEEGKSSEEDTCVWHSREGEESKCITPVDEVGSFLSISPDGRWVTFTRPREIESGVYTNDLYGVSRRAK
jgi:hypothetical protein